MDSITFKEFAKLIYEELPGDFRYADIVEVARQKRRIYTITNYPADKSDDAMAYDVMFRWFNRISIVPGTEDTDETRYAKC